MYIIVGLGNPGKKYENTRHNLGYITLDQLAKKHSIKIEKSKFKSLVGEGTIAGQKVLLVKPETYMNNSGEAVRDVVNFYKIEPENLLVIYDDIDIPMGDIRIRAAGSSGSHNGMKSIVYHLVDDSFPRIRIGIGIRSEEEEAGSPATRPTGESMIDYVIGGFTKKEVPLLEDACTKAVLATECYLEQGIDIAMNRYNVRHKKPKETDGE